ncbi:peptide chain release factor 3, putative [Babesia ovata]|uniref:Peptide chain release factor 3, putative n=1 Tax=Babesia ovata TaxID=189622 RepID=A0A2H6KAD3_9APIC|nr:peptide chain release factor 3, putative [Babesia ovata]GBE59948.1 peptide chain release factor 3, putative [Babesia ovata]
MVVGVVGGGRGGASDALDGMEVGVTKAVPVGAVSMWLGEGGAQWRQLERHIMKLIPEIVEEGYKLPRGTRRPPGEAGEVRGQRQQGILAAASGSEDGGNTLSSFVRSRQIIIPESHPNTALEAYVARVEGVRLELGCGGVSQEGLEGGVGGYITAVVALLPTTLFAIPRTLRLKELQLVAAGVGVVPQLAEESAAIRVLGLVGALGF